MKKKSVIALMAITITMLLAACGGESEKKESKNNGKETITYSIWDDNQADGMRKIAEAFMEKNADIEVKVESVPWDQYWTKLEAGASGNNMPDIFWMHGNEAARYMDSGVLMDVSTVFDKSNFPEEIVNLYSLDGVNYGIPKDVSSVALFYNKTIFDSAGIDYPDETWDTDKLTEVAKKLTNTEKGIYGFAAPNDNETGYYNFIYANGGSVLSEDKKKSTISKQETQEALQWWLDFIEDGSSPSYTQLSENSAESFFISGRLAMGIFGSWHVPNFMENDYVVKNVDIAPLPKMKERTTIYNGLANAASATTKHPDAVVKFMEYLGSEEAGMIQSESGAAISAYNGTQNKWVDTTSGIFNTQVFVDMLENKVLRPNAKNFQKAESYQSEELAKLLDGKSNVKEITERIEPEITKILNE